MPVFPSVTLPVERVKIRFLEQFASEGINRKVAGIVPDGIYRGFIPEVFSGVKLRLKTSGAPFNDSIAVVESMDSTFTTFSGHSLTVNVRENVELDFTGHTTFPVFVVLRGRYEVTSPTPLQGVTEAKILTVQSADLKAGDVIITQVFQSGSDIVFDNALREETGGPLVTRKFLQQNQLFGGAKSATRDTNLFFSGTMDVPGTTVSFTLTRTQPVLVMMTAASVAARRPFGNQAFINVDGTLFRVGNVDETDSGTVFQNSGASGFAFLTLMAGAHTAKTTVIGSDGRIEAPITILVLAGEPL